MKCYLRRYYADFKVTKSDFTIVSDNGDDVLFKCEAREMKFKDYEERRGQLHIAGCCMQRGTFPLTFSSCVTSPVCLRLTGVIHHRGLKIFGVDNDVTRVPMMNSIVLGYADKSVPMEDRELIDMRDCNRDFQQVLYSHYLEPVTLTVDNDGVVSVVELMARELEELYANTSDLATTVQ